MILKKNINEIHNPRYTTFLPRKPSSSLEKCMCHRLHIQYQKCFLKKKRKRERFEQEFLVSLQVQLCGATQITLNIAAKRNFTTKRVLKVNYEGWKFSMVSDGVCFCWKRDNFMSECFAFIPWGCTPIRDILCTSRARLIYLHGKLKNLKFNLQFARREERKCN